MKRERRRGSRRRAKAINAPELVNSTINGNSLTRRSLKAGNGSLRTAHKRETKAKAKCNEFVVLQQEKARNRGQKIGREVMESCLHTHTQVTGVVCIVAAFYLTCTCPLYRINHTSYSAVSTHVHMCVPVCVFVAPVEDSPKQAQQQRTCKCVCVCVNAS